MAFSKYRSRLAHPPGDLHPQGAPRFAGAAADALRRVVVQRLVMALDRLGQGGLHRGQVIELVDHSNVQIFDAGLAVYALHLRCPSAPL